VIVDAHQHFWDLEREAMPWMTDEHSVIRRTFGPAELAPLLVEAGVAQTVLVQASCSDADTDSMFGQAARHDWIGGVIAWIDLRSAEQTRARLGQLSAQPKLRGFRHLIHAERDPRWILRDDVREGLSVLEQGRWVVELPCVFPRHLADVPELAARFPGMTFVIDHLAKPPLRTAAMAAWADELRAAAAHGNVAAKVSGLNTVLADDGWRAEDLREAVAVAVEAFGPERLACGSDWPVALLNGDYGKVWRETVRVIEDVAPLHRDQILAATAIRLYGLDPAVAVAGAPS
jgi:L-fuconolactonase